MATPVSIRERITRRALAIAAGITGVASALRPDYRRNPNDYGNGVALVEMGGDEISSVIPGCLDNAATLTVSVIVAPDETVATDVDELINGWLRAISVAYMAVGTFVVSGVELVVEIYPIGSVVYEPGENQAAAGAGVMFRVVYRHDETNPATLGTAIPVLEE